jgi:hypothetical protein
MNATLVARVLLAGAAAAITAAAWAGYRRPDFLLWLGNAVFLCG